MKYETELFTLRAELEKPIDKAQNVNLLHKLST